jgi:hypothetical protein
MIGRSLMISEFKSTTPKTTTEPTTNSETTTNIMPTSATTQSKTPPIAIQLEDALVEDFATPSLVTALIDAKLIERHSIARIVFQLAYYAIRDTSDLNRTQAAMEQLISFLSQAEGFIKGSISSSLLSDLESLVAGAKKQEASPIDEDDEDEGVEGVEGLFTTHPKKSLN